MELGCKPFPNYLACESDKTTFLKTYINFHDVTNATNREQTLV